MDHDHSLEAIQRRLSAGLATSYIRDGVDGGQLGVGCGLPVREPA